MFSSAEDINKSTSVSNDLFDINTQFLYSSLMNDTKQKCFCEMGYATCKLFIGGKVEACEDCAADFRQNHNPDGSFKNTNIPFIGSYEESILESQVDNYL